MSVGIAAEGCADAVRSSLPSSLPSSPTRRRADQGPRRRLLCVREFSEHLQPDICQHHATLLPAVFACLDDAGEEVEGRLRAGVLR